MFVNVFSKNFLKSEICVFEEKRHKNTNFDLP